jgi:hypothetical protein
MLLERHAHGLQVEGRREVGHHHVLLEEDALGLGLVAIVFDEVAALVPERIQIALLVHAS